jgi:hypothetical protein
MKVIAYGFVAFLALCAVTMGSAAAFNTLSDDNTKADGSARFVDPDEKLNVERDAQQNGSKTMRFGQSSVTYGVQMQSGSRLFPGHYGNAGREPTFGTDMFGNTR